LSAVQSLHWPTVLGHGGIASLIRPCLVLCLLSLTIACSTTLTPDNQAITAIEESSGYRRLDNARLERAGDTILLVAFSGGGTRAAALSYGVMEELRDTLLTTGEGREIRLLDEVDTISSVSGGSFTSAYYGLFGDQLFEDFEDVFLRQGVQQALLQHVINPVHWVRSSLSGFDRTETAIDYYDRKIFRGATFSDMRQDGPFIEINATDLGTGMRFSFTQERLDFICTDLGSVSVARAVTASSAVPVVFPTVVLKNHADQCDLSDTMEWQLLMDARDKAQTGAQSELVEGLISYRDVERRPYIHLVDGGIADNLGLRAMTDRFETFAEEGLERLSDNPPRNILVILVNAQVKPERLLEQTAKKPGASTTMSAFTSAQMDRYNQETLEQLMASIADFEVRAPARGLNTRVYFAEVAFDQFKSKEVSAFFNSLPTSLELDDTQVDRLIGAGRLLLRHEAEFERFKADNGARLKEGAVTDAEICGHFDYAECPVGQI
jgi:NTE family protein